MKRRGGGRAVGPGVNGWDVGWAYPPCAPFIHLEETNTFHHRVTEPQSGILETRARVSSSKVMNDQGGENIFRMTSGGVCSVRSVPLW